MAQYILAVDGGGTKTEVLCATSEGEVVGRGLSGPTNLTSTSVGAASFNLKEAVRQACEMLPPEQEFLTLTMGLAGMDTPEEEAVAHKVFFDSLGEYHLHELVLVNDSEIALENGSSKPDAIVLISGTGSICFGRNAAGESAKSGGMDFLLTDQGSGYEIGREVLRTAVKSYDGRASKSLLEGMVCEQFGVASIAELKRVVYNPTLTKIEVAELAKACAVAHDQSDKAATRILQQAAGELANHAVAVVRALRLMDQDFDVVFSGAVLQIPEIQRNVSELIESQFRVSIIRPTDPPVYGALRLAQRLLVSASE